jgi:hypothetical protein
VLGSFGQPQNDTATIFQVVAAYTKICLDQPIDQLHCYPDEYLEAVIDRMMQANIAHLAVVSRGNEKLRGYLSWKDLLRVRVCLQEEERQRVRFYRQRSACRQSYKAI